MDSLCPITDINKTYSGDEETDGGYIENNNRRKIMKL